MVKEMAQKLKKQDEKEEEEEKQRYKHFFYLLRKHSMNKIVYWSVRSPSITLRNKMNIVLFVNHVS